jgi:ABC-type Fe3+ transport system permease subunit
MKKSVLKISAGIIVLFAVLLPLYYVFSAQYGDGLEKTMEVVGIKESEQVWKAPFSYGEDYLTTLAFGLAGFFLTLFIVYLIGFAMKKRKDAAYNGTQSHR